MISCMHIAYFVMDGILDVVNAAKLKKQIPFVEESAFLGILTDRRTDRPTNRRTGMKVHGKVNF